MRRSKDLCVIFAAMDSSGVDTEPLLQGVQYPPLYSPALSSAFRPDSSSQEGEGHLSEWAEGQYTSSGANPILPSVPSMETASLATVNEIREAASQDPYPQWIYGALLDPEVSSQRDVQPPQVSQPSATQDSQSNAGAAPIREQSHVTEEEIREILTAYVEKQGCWGGRPANEWVISKIEDCNVYVGTLETFIEERDVERLVKPYTGGPVQDNSSKHVPGPWEIDMRHEFPLLFTTSKMVHQKIPSSVLVQPCGDCSGRKEVSCPRCNPNKDLDSCVHGVTTECSKCHGRGLLAHQDGSDTNCEQCRGKGRLPCAQCNSRGRIQCGKCQGSGALLEEKQLNVKWSTLISKKISTSINASLVPDDVFHEAKGIQLYSSESYQCQPVSFPNSLVLTRLSSNVIAERIPVPPTARVISERHQVHMIPVTRVSVGQGRGSFKFHIVGVEKHIYLKDYPDRCCWGLCGLGTLCSIL